MRNISTIVIILSSLFLFGCMAKAKGTEPPEGSAANFDQGYYYTFNDILVPAELELDDTERYLLEDTKFKAGIEVFYARVVMSDLINFFLNNMAKDGWERKDVFMGQRSLLKFEKFNKSCTIQIIEEDYSYKLRTEIFAVESKGGPEMAPQQ